MFSVNNAKPSPLFNKSVKNNISFNASLGYKNGRSLLLFTNTNTAKHRGFEIKLTKFAVAI